MSKKVQTNLIKQNCFLSDMIPSGDHKHDKHPKTYQELRVKDLPNGIVQELTDVDYPITPDSVKSYVDSTNYKADPVGAVVNRPKRQNLGDVSQAQKVVSMDYSQAHDLIDRIKNALAEELKKQKVEPKVDPAPEGAPNA